jgi:uncharacterized protein
MTASDIISLLDLKPLEIEGGFFRETYRSPQVIPASALGGRYGSDRPASTCIYYLLTSDTVSRMHRLPSDEVFHFYLGDPVEMLVLHAAGSGSTATLGLDLMAGQRPQVLVPGGNWQGCMLADGGDYALLGTTVAPGFEYADFELGDCNTLAEQYPDYAGIIRELT